MRLSFPPHLSPSPTTNCRLALKEVLAKYGLEGKNFTTLPYDEGESIPMTSAHGNFAHKNVFVHIGMGGSSLGPQMLIKTLGGHSQRQFHFLDNSDPELVAPIIESCDLRETLFYVVSKSGTTTETMAILSLVMAKLARQNVPPSRWKEYLVFCTDPERGDLRAMANDLDILALPIPGPVGGRFSVLSAVGLFPAQFAGIDTRKLMEGAKGVMDNLEEGTLARLLNALEEGYSQHQISHTVLMPYCQRLQSFNEWFVQLWSESLGKRGLGPTPLGAIGAKDQHSQMQLFMDGPRDKFFVFIEVEEFADTGPLGETSLPYSSLRQLSGYSLAQLIQCQLKGTMMALDDKKIPYALLSLERVEEGELGQLIMLFELLTTLVGKGLGINPFDQPGVELGKRYTAQLLSRSHLPKTA